MTKIIGRNTTVPTKKSEFFSTAQDNQTSVQIHVLQGEREFANDNKSLGDFKLDGIPLAPRNVPKIEVTFDIDVNGILTVRAKDNNTGVETSIIIEGSSKLSESDIDKMIADAEEFANMDKKRRELTQLKNNADSLIYDANKKLENLESNDQDNQKDLIDEIKDLIKVIENSLNSEDIETITTNLQNLQQKLNLIVDSNTPVDTAVDS